MQHSARRTRHHTVNAHPPLRFCAGACACFAADRLHTAARRRVRRTDQRLTVNGVDRCKVLWQSSHHIKSHHATSRHTTIFSDANREKTWHITTANTYLHITQKQVHIKQIFQPTERRRSGSRSGR
jgi:hypothetical protein